MNKKLILLAAASMVATLASCGGASSSPAATSHPTGLSSEVSSQPSTSSAESSASAAQSSSIAEIKYVVTFDLNYAGSTPITVEVKEGETVSEPNGAVREGYGLAGWYTEAACTNAFDFSTPITANLTLYADWIVVDENTRTATFHWNLTGKDDVYTVVYFTKGKRVTQPASPTADGFNFRGWYNEATCDTAWSYASRYEENIDVYAKWFIVNTWEAEHVQFLDMPDEDIDNGLATAFGEKIGHGYSSDTYGLANIFPNRGHEASNGWYVANMYYYGAYIEFDVTSDREVHDAVLIARLSCEYFDMSFEPGYYDFEVNGVALDYDRIDLKLPAVEGAYKGLAPKQAEGDQKVTRKFTNHTITSALTLQEGLNKIRLVTHNTDRQDNTGTMDSMAPLVDCLYCYSDADLSFDIHTENGK